MHIGLTIHLSNYCDLSRFSLSAWFRIQDSARNDFRSNQITGLPPPESARGLAQPKTLRAVRASPAIAPASWSAAALRRFSSARSRCRGVHLPSDGSHLPFNGIHTPSSGIHTPSSGIHTPSSGIHTPSQGIYMPSNGNWMPVRGKWGSNRLEMAGFATGGQSGKVTLAQMLRFCPGE
jgi:hypothetical protein